MDIFITRCEVHRGLSHKGECVLCVCVLQRERETEIETEKERETETNGDFN